MPPKVVRIVGKVDPETEFEEKMGAPPPGFNLAKQWPSVLIYSLGLAIVLSVIMQSDKIIALFHQ